MLDFEVFGSMDILLDQLTELRRPLTSLAPELIRRQAIDDRVQVDAIVEELSLDDAIASFSLNVTKYLTIFLYLTKLYVT